MTATPEELRRRIQETYDEVMKLDGWLTREGWRSAASAPMHRQELMRAGETMRAVIVHVMGHCRVTRQSWRFPDIALADASLFRKEFQTDLQQARNKMAELLRQQLAPTSASADEPWSGRGAKAYGDLVELQHAAAFAFERMYSPMYDGLLTEASNSFRTVLVSINTMFGLEWSIGSIFELFISRGVVIILRGRAAGKAAAEITAEFRKHSIDTARDLARAAPAASNAETTFINSVANYNNLVRTYLERMESFADNETVLKPWPAPDAHMPRTEVQGGSRVLVVPPGPNKR